MTNTSPIPDAMHRIIHIERAPLVLWYVADTPHVTLEGMASLLRHTPPNQGVRMLHCKVDALRERLPLDGVTECNGDTALPLPAALKVLAYFGGRDFIALHHTLVDVMVRCLAQRHAT